MKGIRLRYHKMMVLVVGGSGSGKSSYAEETSVLLAQESVQEIPMRKYYLATMQVFDEEGRKKVERHRDLRKGKGFLTIEQAKEVPEALKKMEEGNRTVLLECISNLTANEMFSGEKAKAETQVTEKVIRDIKKLKEQTTHLVVVSNNVFEDGMSYDETTMKYMDALGMINRKLAALADRVVEVVVGIPIIIRENPETDDTKGNKKCG